MTENDFSRIEKDLKDRYKNFKPSNLRQFLKSVFLKKNFKSAVENYYDDGEESKNLDFNNWQDLIEDGVWNLEQEDVNEKCFEIVLKLLSNAVFRDESSSRIFSQKEHGYLHYWVYTRDLFELEYNLTFKRRFPIWLFWELIDGITRRFM